MKKLCVIAVVAMLAITACSSKKYEPIDTVADTSAAETTTAAATTGTTAAETAIETTAAQTSQAAVETTESQTADAAQNEDGNEIRGVVKDAAMNSLLLTAEDGKDYAFSTMDADMQLGGNGLTIGMEVRIIYDGELTADGTVARKVIMKMEDSRLTGTVKDATMNTLTLIAEDGSEYVFSTMDAEKNLGADGITVDGQVTVTYNGELKPDVVMPALKVETAD